MIAALIATGAVIAVQLARQVPLDARHFPDSAFRQLVADSFDANGDGTLSVQEIGNATILTDVTTDLDEFRNKTNNDIYRTNNRFRTIVFASQFYAATEKDDLDSCIQTNECLSAITAPVSGSKNHGTIESLEGIEYLTNLRSIRLCHNMAVGAIDLRRNVQLRYLNLTLDDDIDGLDLTHNPRIAYLHMDGVSVADGSSIDLTSCTNLKYLYWKGRGVDSMDLSRNTTLRHLELHGDTWEDGKLIGRFLISLDLTANTAIAYFDGDQLSIDSLDLSDNPNLRYVNADIESCTSATIDLSHSTGIEYASVRFAGGEASVDLTGLAIASRSDASASGTRVAVGAGDDSLAIVLDDCSDARNIDGLYERTPVEYDPESGVTTVAFTVAS